MAVSRAARECLAEAENLIRRFGPRLTGSAASRATAESIRDSLARSCDTATLESFDVRPGSFYSYTKILPLSYLLGAAAFFFPPIFALIPVVALSAGMLVMFCQFAFYVHFPDFLFRHRIGWNVSATIEPHNSARQVLILSGHHDSAPVARIFDSPFFRLYVPAIFLPYAFFLFELAMLLARLAGGFASVPVWVPALLAGGLPAAAGYFLLVALRRGSPGAGDNLISSLMVARLARDIAADRTLLKSTRLLVVSFDAEEAGLRGAAAWFRVHAPELKRLPCFHLNFDSLYNLRDLQCLVSDVNGTVSLSTSMADELIRCAAAEGLVMRRFGMIFGAGGTDAAESARVGIPSSSIIAMPTELVRPDMVYHTSRDTVEHIEPPVIEACMRIALRYLEQLDGRRDPASP